ncbi:MAG: transcription termination factor NusA [Candidatus Latescibacteria bacterium]|nr:transcription termination factor NusA [Candidatus Latescibacterota bacterium]
MNNKEISNLVTQIARIRNVDITYVIETLKMAIIEGLKRRFGKDTQVEVEINPDATQINVFLIKQVVDTVLNPATEIAKDEAQKISNETTVGGSVRILIPLAEIGRSAIRKASDELVLKLREAERNKLFDEYNRKRGEIISGTVSKIGKDEIAVNIGLTEAILANRDQLKTDHYRQGAPIKAIVYRVEKTPIGPRIFLSRTHNDFLKKLMTKEVPEIREGIVEIKVIARAPGFRAKVAVSTNDEKVDPVGACVGYRKSRIQNIIKELSGEKIDIVLYSKDVITFINRSLAPAKVKEVFKEGDSYFVIVPDEDFSIAIGKKGQNVWLAGNLVGTRLEVLKVSDYKNRLMINKAKTVPIKDLELSEEEITKLQDAQITTAFDILNIPTEQLANVTNYEVEKIEELKSIIKERLWSE